MEDISKINSLLNSLQEESPNSGGLYHFTKINFQYEENIEEGLLQYLLQYPEYKNPYIINQSNLVKVYVKERDPYNLRLDKIEDFDVFITNKLNYWSNHRTSLDHRDDITDIYKTLESEFISALESFLLTKKFMMAYSVKGINTYYCFGKDHVNDDILIKTENGVYVLHFGWSS